MFTNSNVKKFPLKIFTGPIQVQVAAAKGRGHRMLEDIRLPNLLSRKRPRRNKQFHFASLLFMDHSRGTLEFAQSTLTKDSNKDLEMYLPESNNFEEHVL